jgi:hypothetical protein
MIITNLEILSSLCYPFKPHIYASKLKNESLGAFSLCLLDPWDNLSNLIMIYNNLGVINIVVALNF